MVVVDVVLLVLLVGVVADEVLDVVVGVVVVVVVGVVVDLELESVFLVELALGLLLEVAPEFLFVLVLVDEVGDEASVPSVPPEPPQAVSTRRAPSSGVAMPGGPHLPDDERTLAPVLAVAALPIPSMRPCPGSTKGERTR